MIWSEILSDRGRCLPTVYVPTTLVFLLLSGDRDIVSERRLLNHAVCSFVPLHHTTYNLDVNTRYPLQYVCLQIFNGGIITIRSLDLSGRVAESSKSLFPCAVANICINTTQRIPTWLHLVSRECKQANAKEPYDTGGAPALSRRAGLRRIGIRIPNIPFQRAPRSAAG